ncbi:MAG: hypothetical protein ACYDH9_22330 [Limisphaerales bacterium]
MATELVNMLQSLTGLLVGASIGAAFGMIQDAARRRNERLQEGGKLNSGWAVMPGAMRRVGYLMVALALVQIVCPVLFANGAQWWVSCGVMAGYGGVLFRQVRRCRTHCT